MTEMYIYIYIMIIIIIIIIILYIYIYRPFETTVSQLKMCDFSGETFKCFEVL